MVPYSGRHLIDCWVLLFPIASLQHHGMFFVHYCLVAVVQRKFRVAIFSALRPQKKRALYWTCDVVGLVIRPLKGIVL